MSASSANRTQSLAEVFENKTWKNAFVVVECPTARYKISDFPDRNSADLKKLGAPKKVFSIGEAYTTEKKWNLSEYNVTGVGFAAVRGILLSVFSMRNPELLQTFLKIHPRATITNADTLAGAFENNVSTSAVSESDVAQILQDHRLDLSKNMTMGDAFAVRRVEMKRKRKQENDSFEEKVKKI